MIPRDYLRPRVRQENLTLLDLWSIWGKKIGVGRAPAALP